MARHLRCFLYAAGGCPCLRRRLSSGPVATSAPERRRALKPANSSAKKYITSAKENTARDRPSRRSRLRCRRRGAPGSSCRRRREARRRRPERAPRRHRARADIRSVRPPADREPVLAGSSTSLTPPRPQQRFRVRRARRHAESVGRPPRKRGVMIRKLATGHYRLYSRARNPRTGRRRNLGTFKSRAAAEKHERAVQFFKRQA